MFFPLPWFVGLIQLLFYFISGGRKLTEKDHQVLRWLEEPDDPMRPQDYSINRVAQIKEVIRAGRSIYIKYIEADKALTFRRVIPERLFRRGNNIYVHCFCLKEKEMRVFRIDRITHLGD